MDPIRIAVRVVLAYAWLRLMMRVSGNRTIGQCDVSSFVLALIIGDLFDDFFWTEVGAAQFVVAVATLLGTHLCAGMAASGGSRMDTARCRRRAR